MADSAKFTVTDGTGSYIELDGLSLDDFSTAYIAAQVYLPAATEAAWLGGIYSDSPLFIFLRKTSGSVDEINFRDSDADDVYDQWETNYEGTFTGASIADTWHKVEWLREPTNGPGPYSVSIDGTPLFTDTFGPTGTIAKPTFGAVQNHLLAPAAGDFYIARIRIGTTSGGTEILDWDASIASDFSAFTSVTGTVVLDTAPSAPPAWPGGGGGGGPTPVEGVCIALNDSVLTADPVWVRIDT